MSKELYFCREVTVTSGGFEYVKLDLGEKAKTSAPDRTITTSNSSLFGLFIPGKTYSITIDLVS